MLEKPLKILVSIPTCKEPESLHAHPYSKVKLDKLKSNNNTWNHEKFEVSGQTATPESGRLGKSRESQWRSVHLGRGCWNRKLIWTLLMAFLANCCRLHMHHLKSKKLLGYAGLSGTDASTDFSFRNPIRLWYSENGKNTGIKISLVSMALGGRGCIK